MPDPTACPACKADLRGTEIPKRSRHAFGDRTHFLRVIAVYSRELDRTTHWKCPDCGHEWRADAK